MVEVYTFQNSDTCKGVGVSSGVSRTHDVIDIVGSYPEEGYWARNIESREEVIVAQGVGSVALRSVGVVELDASADKKRAVVIESGQWFRWQSDGDMTISMICEPGFDANKYEIKSDQEIEG